jgi:putative sterol carrier protein
VGLEVLKIAFAAALLCVAAAAAAQGEPLLMSAPWAKLACEAWNAEPALTDKLAASGWAGNNAGRGYKVIRIYRSDCAQSPRVELRIAAQDGKARCSYGGAAGTAKLDASADYVMHAETARWQEMGRGEYGPMRAMMFSRLQFEGPMLEAMRNMGPFESFLLLVGKVPGAAACPAP